MFSLLGVPQKMLNVGSMENWNTRDHRESKLKVTVLEQVSSPSHLQSSSCFLSTSLSQDISEYN